MERTKEDRIKKILEQYLISITLNYLIVNLTSPFRYRLYFIYGLGVFLPLISPSEKNVCIYKYWNEINKSENRKRLSRSRTAGPISNLISSPFFAKQVTWKNLLHFDRRLVVSLPAFRYSSLHFIKLIPPPRLPFPVNISAWLPD